MVKPVALVTGASSGIGLELSRLLAAAGHDLVLAARSAEKLDQTVRELHDRYGVHVESRRRDLSEPGGAEILWRELMAEGVAVDILVNNAGVGLHGAFGQQDPDAISRLVTLNVTALTTLTQLALPEMLARRSGRILNVASLVAFQPGGPQEAVYYASKSFVLSFSKGLARELRGSGVSVTALCPGPTKTSFESTAGATDTVLYKWMPSMTAAVVARAGYRGMMRGSGVVIPGVVSKLLALAGELPPRRIVLEVNHCCSDPCASRPALVIWNVSHADE
jgi:short-subunit dehydrogenase